MSEQDYTNGSQQAYLTMLRECLRHLGYKNADSPAATMKWVVERAEIVLALRSICKEFGDNDWPDDLHLADVIEKHLRRHLEQS